MHVWCADMNRIVRVENECSRWLGYSDKISPGTWNCNSVHIQKAGSSKCVG